MELVGVGVGMRAASTSGDTLMVGREAEDGVGHAWPFNSVSTGFTSRMSGSDMARGGGIGVCRGWARETAMGEE